MNLFKCRPHLTHLPEWTPQRQQQLLQLIDQHKHLTGNWALISQHVQEIPTNYSSRWTPHETDKLRHHIQTEYYKKCQKMDWVRISQYMGRSPSACYLRFYKQAKPPVPAQPPVEVYQDKDKRLAKAIRDNIHLNTVQWDNVSKAMQTDLLQVLGWINSNPEISRLVPMRSTEISIEQMLHFINKHITNLRKKESWSLISLYMCVPKIQCMETYHRHQKQSAGISVKKTYYHYRQHAKSSWDPKDQDQIKRFLIRHSQEQPGARHVVKTVCQMFPHRTSSEVRREVERIRQQIASQRTRLYSMDMPKLIHMVEEQGERVDWKEIAKAMRSTPSLCRRRYEGVKSKMEGRRQWTEDETERLREAVGQFEDRINWEVVGGLVATRSPNQCYLKHWSLTRK